MSFFASILHRKGSSTHGHPQQEPEADDATKKESPPSQRQGTPPSISTDPTEVTEQRHPAIGQAAAHGFPATPQCTTLPRYYAPGTGPEASAQMRQANMIGMAGGATIGSATGDPVMGMIEGQVGANLLMQRIQQGQKHQYYREQAIRYRNGLPADGVGDRESPRDRRRKERWERRAKRRDGGHAS